MKQAKLWLVLKGFVIMVYQFVIHGITSCNKRLPIFILLKARVHVVLTASGLATLLQFVVLLQLPWNSPDCFHSTCQCPLNLGSSHTLLLERCCEGHQTILGGSDQKNPSKTFKHRCQYLPTYMVC